MVAPPVQDLVGAFHRMVVSEASTSPAAFSRTVPSPPKQRTRAGRRRWMVARLNLSIG